MRTGAVYAGSRLWAWVARGGILQQATHLPAAEAGERVVDPTPQRDDLEQLAHLGWTQELLRLHSQRQIGRCVPGGGERHEIRDAGAIQKRAWVGYPSQCRPALVAARATAVKSTWLVISCKPGRKNGSSWAR